MAKEEDFIRDFIQLISRQNRIPVDDTPKTIGDRVKLIDIYHLNYFIDAVSDRQLTNHLQPVSDELRELFSSEEMIVADINVEKVYKCGHCNNDYYHDMIIFLPKMNRKFHCSSESFSIIE